MIRAAVSVAAALVNAVFWWCALTVAYGVLGGDRRPDLPPRYSPTEHYVILGGIVISALLLHWGGSKVWTRVERRLLARRR